MKTLMTLLLLSVASLASAESITVLHGDLSPSQVEWQLNNQGVSQEQRNINNARRAQMNAERAERDYNSWREYQNSRVDYERFISH